MLVQDRRQVINLENTRNKHYTKKKSKQCNTQQIKTSLVYSPHTTLGQERRLAYSTTLPSPHGATARVKTVT